MDKAKLVQRLKESFSGKEPSEIISIAYEEFGNDLAITTAFGYSGIILMSFVKEVIPELPIYFIDTKFHFEETLKLAKKIKDDWKLNIINISTQYSEDELEKIIRKEPYNNNPDLCCYYRKVEPLLQILSTKTAWLSATRRDQSSSRAEIKVIETDRRDFIKVNPLYNWTREQCWMYIRKYNLPYNPLHDQYYPSLGCKPCTDPVDKGGSERNGRWKRFQKIECGIHINKIDDDHK